MFYLINADFLPVAAFLPRRLSALLLSGATKLNDKNPENELVKILPPTLEPAVFTHAPALPVTPEPAASLYDFIYITASQPEETARLLREAAPLLRPGGILAGKTAPEPLREAAENVSPARIIPESQTTPGVAAIASFAAEKRPGGAFRVRFVTNEDAHSCFMAQKDSELLEIFTRNLFASPLQVIAQYEPYENIASVRQINRKLFSTYNGVPTN